MKEIVGTNSDFTSNLSLALSVGTGRRYLLWWFLTILTIFPLPLLAQSPSTSNATSTADLYHRLGNAGLDSNAVYRVRDASIDREDVHISLRDGTIAFTQAVDGQVTGALFVGDGDLLIVPPDPTERHSLALFTKIAALSEHFNLVYFRFADAKFIADLTPALRAPDEPQEFLDKYVAVAKSLSEAYALRTFIGLTHGPATKEGSRRDFLYARISGERLGTFDLLFDPSLDEQITVGQASFTEHGRFYDLWMSFPMRSVRQRLAEGESQVFPIEITDYKIRLDVRPPNDLSVEASLNLNVLLSGDRALAFELSRYLKLSAVTLETPNGPSSNLDYIQNQAMEGTELDRRGNDIVAVVFAQPLLKGQKVRLKFVYSGSVMSEAGAGLMYVGARGTWYPNRGPSMANFDLEFHYPSDWKLVATGKMVDQQAEGDKIISHWVSERPMPLSGFNLGKYSITSAKSGAVKLESYSARGMEATFQARQAAVQRSTVGQASRAPGLIVDPTPPPSDPDPTRNAQKVLGDAARTIEFLAPRIGPYPYSSLSLTQMPGATSQGWPGLVFLSSYVFLSPEQRAQSRIGGGTAAAESMYEGLMTSHETAHQWWGDQVYWRGYRDQWIMEALANYCALLKLENEDPAQFQKIMEFYRKDLLTKPDIGEGGPFKDAGPVTLGMRLNSSKYGGAYVPVAYGRGTWLIHMLRHMLRDSERGPRPASKPNRGKLGAAAAAAVQTGDPDAVFYSVLKGLLEKFSGKSMTNFDLQNAFEQVMPPSMYFERNRSLAWFFDGWVNGTALPEIKLENVKFSKASGRVVAIGSLRQRNAPDLLVTSVPIYADIGGGALVFVTRVFADGDTTEIKLVAPAGTRKLVVDPYRTVLTDP